MNTELLQSLYEGLNAESNTWVGQQMSNLDIPVLESGTPSSIVDSFLQSDFDNVGDVNIKKIMAAAQLIGHSTGVIHLDNVSPIGLAATADESSESAKTLFKIATNQISIEEASDRMIDVAATRLVASTDVIIDKGVDLVSTKLLPILGQVYPPLQPIELFASVILQSAKPTIKQVMKAAIPLVKEKVKVITRNLIAEGRKMISKLFA